MTILFDGTNHPSAQQVIDADCGGCLMYGGTPQYAKNFTAAQYRDYKSNGLLTLFAFEVDANDMNGGSAAGVQHARALISDLRSKGVDEHEPVCATVDKHVAAANIPLAVAYQRGFRDAVRATGWLGPVGGYGFSEFLIAIHDAGVADWYWGAGARSSMPAYTNIWQDNTRTILVGGSADDPDWVLIQLSGGNMDWSDQIPFNQTPANPKQTAAVALCIANADLYAGNAMTNTAVLLTQLSAVAANVTAVAKALDVLQTTEQRDHADEMTAVQALRLVDSADLQQPLHDALTALGWTAPPTTTDTADAVLTAIKTQLTK